MKNIAVLNALRFERLILSETMSRADGLCTGVKLGNTPKLKIVRVPGARETCHRDTRHDWDGGDPNSPSMMLMTVKKLCWRLCFRAFKDIKMIPTLFRFFSNVEMLHIKVVDERDRM